MSVRGFNLDDEDYAALSDYAYANRLSLSRALRLLIREHAKGEPQFGLPLEADVKEIIQTVANKMRGPGRPSGDLFDKVGNELIRRGAKR